MRIPRAKLIPCAISTVVIGCGDANIASDRRQPEITDSAGIRRVLNYEKRWRTGEEWTISAEPVLRIGMLDGPQEFLFDRIAGVTRLSDGTIVVLNAGDGQLRFFSRDGSHLRSVGGIGGGPGEVRGARWLDRLEGDLIQVTNNDGRIRFRPDGTLLSDDRLRWDLIHRISRRANLTGSPGFLMESCGLPAPMFVGDLLLLCASTYSDVRFLPTTSGLHERVSLVATSDLSLQALDTLGKFVTGSLIRYQAAGRLHSARFGPPYGPRGRMRVTGTPARFVYDDAQAYRIDVYSINPPRLVLIVERVGGLRAPTELELAGFDRAFAPDRRLSRQPPGNPDEFRNQVNVADSVSIISSAPYLDVHNSVWVPLESPQDATHRPFDIFDASGIYLGQVLLPRYRFTIHEIGDDYILGVTSDDVGVEYVTMYNLARPVRSSGN